MKKDLFGKLTAFRSIILFFLVMLTGLVANADGTAGSATKLTPYVLISNSGYGEEGKTATYFNDTKFIEPNVIVYESEKKQTPITNRFYISYYLTSGNKTGADTTYVNEKGKIWNVDKVTGTRVETRYGDVETGSKAGIVYVHVKVVPADRYANDFTEAENTYTIRLNKVKADIPVRVVPSFVTNENYHNGWYAAAGSTISLPNFKIEYKTTDSRDKNKNMTLDITKRFDITATIEEGSDAEIKDFEDKDEEGNTVKSYKGLKIGNTTGEVKIKFSFNPVTPDAYEPLNNVEYTLNVVNAKVHPQIVFPEGGDKTYWDCTQYKVLRPTIYDQFGNELTNFVGFHREDSKKALWASWSMAPLADGKTMHTPYTGYTLSETMQEAGGQPLPDGIVRENDWAAVPVIYGMDNVNTGRPVYYKDVALNPFVQYSEWDKFNTAKMAEYDTKVYCQVYPNSNDKEATNIYEASEASYNLHIMVRSSELVIEPDPSTVKFTKGSTITWENRFNVYAVHTAKAEDSHFGRKEGDTVTLKHNLDATDAQDVLMNYTFKFRTGDAEVTGYLDDHHVTVDENGNVVTTPVEGKTYEVYSCVKGYGTDPNWTLTFKKSGQINIQYDVYPWNHYYCGPAEGSVVINKEFDVDDKISPVVKVTPDPIVIYTKDDEFPTQPNISVTDQLGDDIKENYDLTFEIEGDDKTKSDFSKGITIDEDGNFIINKGNLEKGDYKIKVIETPKKGKEDQYEQGETTFRIIVKDLGDQPRFSWNVYDENGNSIGTGSNGNIQPDDKIHGKLSFTGAGLVSGGYSIDAIPGLAIQLGKVSEAKGDSATMEDPWIATVSEEDNNKVVVYGDPVVVKENGIPTDGTFYILMPRTNGFFTLDAKFKAGNAIVLTDEKGKEKQTIKVQKTEKKPIQFRYPIYANTKYYLYNAGDADSYEPLKVHGFSFEPAFINQRNDAKPIESATAYANGFAGALPSLTNEKVAVDDNVKYNITGNINNGYGEINDYAEIDTKYGIVTTKNKGTAGDVLSEGSFKVNNFKNDITLKKEYLKVYAEVSSAYTNGGEKVKKVPSYDLYIGDIPTYIMKNGYTPNVLENISTTNYPTHIRAFFGGWENASNRPYIKNNKINETDLSKIELLVDSWKTSKMDSVGSNDRVIDNFSYGSFGTQNASSETVNTKFTYDKDDEDQTYNVPCRGTYVQFEPSESGTIAVYIIQNGMVAYDGDPDNAKKSGMNKLKINPVFITDETGTPVKLATWTHTVEGAGTDAYTEAVIRCDYNDIIRDCGKVTYDSKDQIEGTILKKIGYIPDEDGKIKEGLEKGKQQKIYDIAKVLDENAISGSNGYSVITKAYTRYSFRVKAGKSYFLFMNGSKLGNDGFAFMPDDWKANRTEKHVDTVVLDELGDATKNAESKDEFIGKEDTFDKYDKTVNVKLYHTFKANQWTALSLPFSVNDSQIRKVFGDDAWVISLDQITDKATVNNVEYQNVAQFLQHNYHWIVAGRPYFIRPGKDFKQTFDEDENGRQYIKLDSVTFERNTYTDANKYDTGSGYIQAKTLTQNKKEVFNFKAIYAPTTIAAGDYFIGSTTGGEAKLYRATKDTNLSGYRAYIDNKGKANGARIGSFGFGDFDEEGNKETTGIDEVYEFYDNGMGKKIAGKKGVFSVDGVKVAENAADIDRLPAGVYIVNGQTVVK